VIAPELIRRMQIISDELQNSGSVTSLEFLENLNKWMMGGMSREVFESIFDIKSKEVRQYFKNESLDNRDSLLRELALIKSQRTKKLTREEISKSIARHMYKDNLDGYWPIKKNRDDYELKILDQLGDIYIKTNTTIFLSDDQLERILRGEARNKREDKRN